jgi:superfamily II DNA or RNA helicase|tara:strand:+ start:1791 stop:3650 length:1860 start_codon:yes stop_codon:yes gene_type:complete
MLIKISEVTIYEQNYVKLTKFDIKNDCWNSIKNSIRKFQDTEFKEQDENSITAEWVAFLSSLSDLRDLKHFYKFKWEYDAAAKQKIIENNENLKLLRGEGSKIELKESDFDNLKNLGFSKLILTSEQERDLKFLLSKPHGANFSVQGSGKTAVTIATHLFLRNDPKIKANSLLIVCPKNAFLAWEDEFNACLEEGCILKKEGLTELTGSYESLKTKLNSKSRNFIINYEKLINNSNLVAGFIQKNRVHFILDESHKIKSELAQRSQAVLNLAYRLNFVRKDILTGTPAPNKREDINSQFNFLYTGAEYEKKNKRFWARTTKRELKLPEPSINLIPVDMTKAQLILYTNVLDPFIESLKLNSTVNADNYIKLRRSIIKLIQISSNPILVTKKQEEEGEIIPGDTIDFDLHRALSEEDRNGGSAKIRFACSKARELAKEGKKTVIWSYFRDNIAKISQELSDLKSEYIHGGVQVGNDEDEINTRKNKIKKFKEQDCMVLVANYASCAEGISLHKVCHDAIYIDRSFQADQYLQSVDRICRLGNQSPKNIYILQSRTPIGFQNIDLKVSNALKRKIDMMGRFLDDADLINMSLSETKGKSPIDKNISYSHLQEIINDFLSKK